MSLARLTFSSQQRTTAMFEPKSKAVTLRYKFTRPLGGTGRRRWSDIFQLENPAHFVSQEASQLWQLPFAQPELKLQLMVALKETI